MNKLLFIMLLITSYSYSQDTLIISENGTNKVIVTDSIHHWSVTFYYKKSIEIKDGLYKLITNNLMTIGSYSNGKTSGVWKSYHNEKLFQISHFKNGKLNGEYLEYVGGEIIKKGTYKNDLRVGKWQYFNKGNLVAKGKYSGRFVLRKSFNTSFGHGDNFIFSDGDTITVFNNTVEYDNFFIKYGIDLSLTKIWLRKGKWEYFDKNKNRISLLKYNNKGILKKENEKGNETSWIFPIDIIW